MSEIPRAAVLLVAAVALSACKPAPLPGEANATVGLRSGPAEGTAMSTGPDPVLVEMPGYMLTLNEFERRAELLSAVAESRLNTKHGRNGLLEMLVWMELLAGSAVEEGLQNSAFERLLVEEARARARLESHAAGTVDRDALNERLPEYYRSRRDEFVRPERRNVYGIVVADRELAERVHSEVETALEHGRRPFVFERLSSVYSIHAPSVANDGDYGWLIRREDGGTGDPALIDAVFAAEGTGLAPIVRTSRGWEVFLIAAIEPARELELRDVEAYLGREQYLEHVGADKRRQLDEQRERQGVEIDAEAVAALAAARADEPEHGLRPRRFSGEALSGDPGAELGYGVLEELAGELAAIQDNPYTRPADPPVIPAEGSAEAAPEL